jgi:hypothetical protein
MSLIELATSAPYCLATAMSDINLGRFWVVQLSCGFEVYQTEDDPTLEEPNSWMRLKAFCDDNDVQIVNMARANKNLDQSNQVNLDPMADGYYYARRVRHMMSYHPAFSGYNDNAEGIGQLHKNVLKIIWEIDGGGIEVEERKLDDNPKSNFISLIKK